MWQDERYTYTEREAYRKNINHDKTGNWEYARWYCEDLIFAGFDDWYLPNKEELMSIVDKSNKPAIQNTFKNAASNYYWSSTSYAADTIYAWSVDFGNGDLSWGFVKTVIYYIRCVRRHDFDSFATSAAASGSQKISKPNNKAEKTAKKKDTLAPTITIISPDINRAVKPTSQASMSIEGMATDDVAVSEVSINGESIALDVKGNFSHAVRTKVGENIFEVIAIDTSGNETKKSIKVTRDSAVAKAPKPQKSIPDSTNELGEVGRYYALIIGVQNYDDSEIRSLEFPVKDAKRFATTLSQNYQFDRIIPLHNPTRADILNALEKLADEIKPNDNLLIFYAGHGYWDDKINQGYWLPRDAKKKSKASWLSNSELKDYLAGIKSRHTLLVSDACFGGSIFKTRNAFDEDKSAKALYELPSRIAMTSGALKEVPDKSVFLDYMIKRLGSNNKKFLSAGSLYNSFKEAVISASPNHQIPQYGAVQVEGNEGGDFVFIRK